MDHKACFRRGMEEASASLFDSKLVVRESRSQKEIIIFLWRKSKMVQLRRNMCQSDPKRERLSRLMDCLLAYFVDVTFFDAEDAKMQNNQRA